MAHTLIGPNGSLVVAPEWGDWSYALEPSGQDTPPTCTHDFVNVAFNHIKMVCKHCDQEQT